MNSEEGRTSEGSRNGSTTRRNNKGKKKGAGVAGPTATPLHNNVPVVPLLSTALPLAPGGTATEEEDGEELCFICADTVTWYAIGECNHKVCHLCSLRLRALYKQKSCALCKTELHDVVYTKNPDALFQDFNLRKMPAYDHRLRIYFESSEIQEDVMILLRFNCPDPSCDVSCTGGWGELKEHVKKGHGMLMCNLCTRHKKLFTHEHTLYTKATLDRHNKLGDPDDPSFKGHPTCGFCRNNFYGQDELFEHCREKHEQCFLCQRNGVRNQYFQNYAELESHFRSDHFPCYAPECLEKKFVVFNSNIDLKGHELEEHSSGKAKAKGQAIELNFTYTGSAERDFGRDHSKRSSAKRGGRQGNDRDGQREGEGSSRSGANNFGPGSAPDHQIGNGMQRLRPPPGFGSKLSEPEPPAQASSSSPTPHPAASPRPQIPSMPTPSEAAAGLSGAANALSQPTGFAIGPPATVEGEIMQKVQQLFLYSATKIAEFKSLATSYRQSLINADEFVTGFMSLAAQNKTGKHKKDAEAEAAKIWRRMADTVPDPEEEPEANVGGKGKGKARSKGVPLSLGPRTGGRLKNDMLRALNDWKVSSEEYPLPRPTIPSYANSTATPSAVLPHSTTKIPASAAARVLVIKKNATKQRTATRGGGFGNASSGATASAKDSVWERVSHVPGASAPPDSNRSATPVTFAGSQAGDDDDRPATPSGNTTSTPSVASAYSHPTLQVNDRAAPAPKPAFSKTVQSGRIMGGGNRVSDNEFPGLPKRAPKPPPRTINGRIGGSTAWGEDSSQGSASGSGTESGKKSKKGVTLMHFG
ncbi:uncharacterized protein EV422DRAFT_570086 [Fimicolochytrium jonesii]|uniref:uncharacterized protein n=1 Tax=Fimicolochytrium jonesii TaxID=1396493 RepID=UPI0022FEA756|nr:uncharacterized protein EV422DRAFT_570086 [Fimicolochytrium jonesii]KAI8817933.1 hypothetical protein EV422DRAFT_570086 [Fimicolochytrium jonesii]